MIPLPEGDLPLMRKAAPAYERRAASIDGLVEALIERIARQRGEQIDTE